MSESRLVALARQAQNLQPERRTNTLSELRGRWSDYVNPYQTPPQQLSDLANPLRWPAMAVEGIQTAVETVPRMLQPGYDYSDTRQAAEDAFNVAGVVGAGSLLGTAAKPANAVGTFGGKLGGAAGDLDMSQAARMARAKEMGFDTDQAWYHGTVNDVSPGFDPEKFGSNTGAKDAAAGVFMADHPVATKYFGGFGDQITPEYALWLNRATAIDEKYKNDPIKQKASWMNSAAEDDELEALTKEIFGDLPTEYDPRSGLPIRTINPPDSKKYVQGWADGSNVMKLLTRGNILELDGSTYDPRKFSHAINAARNEGYDGVRIKGIKDDFEAPITHDQLVIFDPANIRSVNAAFDPAKSDSANLLASRGAPVPVEQRRRRDKDEIF